MFCHIHKTKERKHSIYWKIHKQNTTIKPGRSRISYSPWLLLTQIKMKGANKYCFQNADVLIHIIISNMTGCNPIVSHCNNYVITSPSMYRMASPQHGAPAVELVAGIVWPCQGAICWTCRTWPVWWGIGTQRRYRVGGKRTRTLPGWFPRSFPLWCAACLSPGSATSNGLTGLLTSSCMRTP